MTYRCNLHGRVSVQWDADEIRCPLCAAEEEIDELKTDLAVAQQTLSLLQERQRRGEERVAADPS